MAVPPENLDTLLALFAAEDVDAAAIGEFSSDGRLKVMHGAETLVDMDMAFLHDGVPKRSMESRWAPPPAVKFPKGAPLQKSLLAVLAQPTVASKEWVVRQYDHEVQGRTVVKPFVGPTGVGPSDAAVLQLHPSARRGVALSAGLNPHYSRWDAYWMAASAIDEAVRNLIAVGARPDRIAILDNFCGGNPWRPEILGDLVRAAQACHDIARVYGTPFISGKDSLFNEFEVGGRRRAIPTTLLISALSLVDDVAKAVTMDFKKPGNWIYAVGETRDEMGGSRYGVHLATRGGAVPRLTPEETWPTYEKLAVAIAAGLVTSCHDASEGGLGVALAEMCFGGGWGARVDLRQLPLSADLRREGRTDKVLFSESNGRFLVEVAPRSRQAFLKALDGAPVAALGQVREASTLTVLGLDGKSVAWTLPELEKSWRSGGPA